MDPRARLGIEDRPKYAPALKRDVNLSLVYKGTSLTSGAYRWPRISGSKARFLPSHCPFDLPLGYLEASSQWRNDAVMSQVLPPTASRDFTASPHHH